MKKFTCKEMGGVCDEVFEGNTYREVGEKGGAHIMSSTDKAHEPLRKQMASSTEEDKNKWWAWFKGEWDKKKDNKEKCMACACPCEEHKVHTHK